MFRHVMYAIIYIGLVLIVAQVDPDHNALMASYTGLTIGVILIAAFTAMLFVHETAMMEYTSTLEDALDRMASANSWDEKQGILQEIYGE